MADDKKTEVTEEVKDVKSETHQEVSARRAAELSAILDTHHANVNKVHEDHPTPPGKKFHELTEEEQRSHNLKREVIDSANRAYNRAVKAACTRHRDEELAARVEFNAAWRAKMAAEEAGAPAPHEGEDAR